MWNKKQQNNPKQMTAQEFINTEEIVDGILYTTDGYLYGYLKVRTDNHKLLSEEEQKAHISNLTQAMEHEKEPWTLLGIPRTIDTLGMIDHLADMRRNCDEDARLKLLNGEITALQEMTAEGTKEPVIILKLWEKAARGADKTLKKRLHEVSGNLTENGVDVTILHDREVTHICKLFADLTTYQDMDEVYTDDIPILKEEKRIFTKRTENSDQIALRNLITPIGGLHFGVNRVTIGDVSGRIYGAVRYPAELSVNWASPLMNSSDCITSITFLPDNLSQLSDALSRSIKRNSVDAEAESDVRRRKRFQRQANDADELIDELDYKNASVGHATILVMPFTSHEEKLDEVCRNVLKRFSRIKFKPLSSMQKTAYKYLSPYYPNQSEIDMMVSHIMPLHTLMGGAPMTVNVFRDDRGYYFARTTDGGIISLDLLFRGADRTNGNIVCTGIPGMGKSTALKHICETLYMSRVKIIVMDPEREFRDLCFKLGGTWIDAGGGTAKINPLQIRPVPPDDDDYKDQPLFSSDENAMALHMRTLEIFHQLYLPSLTDLQRAMIKKSLIEVYAKFGITWETDVSSLTPEQFPTYTDLINLFEERSQSDDKYETLAALFFDIAHGADSFLWNGHTNINPSSDFVCFDTQKLMNSSDTVKRAQYFNVLSLCWELLSTNRQEPVMLLCDEGYILLDPEIPEAAKYARNISKRCRKYEGMLAFVTHSIVDMLQDGIKPYGQALLDNAAYKILFGADGKNLKDTAELFYLTESEQNILLKRQKKKALLLCGAQRMEVNFDIPAYKLELMGKGGGR